MSLAPADCARLEALLRFWFADCDRPRDIWWKRDDVFDRACAQGFAADHLRAAAGELDGWMAEPDGSLGVVLLLDQLPRNIFRGTPHAWATDGLARNAARAAIAAGHDRRLSPVRRLFVYLPFQHSEDPADQDEAVRLCASLTDHPDHAETLRIAERHREIVVRFGRFPHRNAVLGRATTPQERAFLAEPESSF